MEELIPMEYAEDEGMSDFSEGTPEYMPGSHVLLTYL